MKFMMPQGRPEQLRYPETKRQSPQSVLCSVFPLREEPLQQTLLKERPKLQVSILVCLLQNPERLRDGRAWISWDLRRKSAQSSARKANGRRQSTW